jgi:hypothetical protein
VYIFDKERSHVLITGMSQILLRPKLLLATEFYCNLDVIRNAIHPGKTPIQEAVFLSSPSTLMLDFCSHYNSHFPHTVRLPGDRYS